MERSWVGSYRIGAIAAVLWIARREELDDTLLKAYPMREEC